MIEFNYETEFELDRQDELVNWIEKSLNSEGFKAGDINYIFCDDNYLHKLNVEFLNHDTFTDIISFDYSVGKIAQGDIFISIDRVQENANEFNVHFDEELHRVIIHGILHFCGYKDKTKEEEKIMRERENYYLLQLI